MRDYQCLKIAGFCKSSATILPNHETIPVGKQLYHGIPFQVGSPRKAGALIVLGKGAALKPLTIPIGSKARHVLFAHRLLDSRLDQGEPIGRVCAEYIFEFENGTRLSVPIRERFEIASIPTAWGQLAFLAYPDCKDGMQPRHEGAWGEAGLRQTEGSQASPKSFYIWAWKNPHPDQPLRALIIRPAGPRFLIGAITLGHLEENPFPLEAKREVKITLSRKSDARKPFNLEVEVDRGVSGYPQPLPEKTAREFLVDSFQGWGEAQNPNSSPVYVEISATPSATVTVKQDGKKLGSFRWSDLEAKGKLEPTPRLKLELVTEGRNWVRTQVLDDITGQPVPCRIHFRSIDGIPFQPHGHHHHVNSNLGTWHVDIGGDVRLGQITYAYIQGKCEGWLPRGEVLVDIARGFEYEPIRRKIEIKPGQQELVFRLKRLCNMNEERYFSGDTHVHFLSTQGAHFEAAGEDLNVVNLLLSQWGHLFTNTEEFTGEPSVARDGKTIVYATQENRQHILGHLTLLGLKKPVMPWCSDGPGEAEQGSNLETTLSHWADACHAQGGTVVIPHLPTPNCEPAALIATGRADAAEMLVHSPYNHQEYYRYLNCGYKIPLTGGTDKMTADVPVGIYRTYVYIPPDEPFTYDNWCRNLRGGNTFLSGGPILRFRVEGQMIGSTLRLPKGGGTVEVEAVAESVLPIHSLEVVMNGNVVARTEIRKGTKQLKLNEKIKVAEHSWLALRCAGPNYSSVKHHDGWRRGIMAHTSPVYIAVGGEWWMFNAETANYLVTLLHGGLDYIRQRAHQWKPGTVTHHHGNDDHLKFLEAPFRQALDAIHKRMHQLGVPH